jgi:hypothetical protein
MIAYAAAPVLLQDVIEDSADVLGLLERNAPYTPLGGWYRPGADPDAAIFPMWFQNDWVHADLRVPGSELFLFHERVMQAARDFYSAEVILPHSVYVNLMVGIDKAGPAHTDNPRFEGRSRANTPMWLLRTMFWSGLFDEWAIVQATSIWWMNDVEGGGFLYWPDGPGEPPQQHVGDMANTALVGDNHGMFHQVGAVGPYDLETRLVSARAELAPAKDGSGDWAISDRGEVRHQAPIDRYRVSVLWKADVYESEDEHKRLSATALSIPDVARVFDRDLAERGTGLRLDLDRLEDPGLMAEVSAVYPEPKPKDAAPSIFDGAY